MTLRQKLEQLNNDELIYIGSKSAFFFIGTVSEFKEKCNELQAAWENKFQANFDSSERRIKLHLEKKPKEGTEVKKVFKNFATGKHEGTSVPYEQLLAQWQRHLDGLEKYRVLSIKQLERFKPFMGRKVIESYHRIDPDDGVCIIIKGFEVGSYWFYEDTKKKHIEDDEDDEQDYDFD